MSARPFDACCLRDSPAPPPPWLHLPWAAPQSFLAPLCRPSSGPSLLSGPSSPTNPSADPALAALPSAAWFSPLTPLLAPPPREPLGWPCSHPRPPTRSLSAHCAPLWPFHASLSLVLLLLGPTPFSHLTLPPVHPSPYLTVGSPHSPTDPGSLHMA